MLFNISKSLAVAGCPSPGKIAARRRSASFAALVGAGALLSAASASAQAADPLDCLPNSTGPTSGDAAPYDGGMCDLGPFETGANSEAYGISGDGQVVVGYVDDGSEVSAFTWTSEDGMTELEPLSTTSATVLWRARAVNEDGSVIVGNARNDLNRARNVRWVDGNIEDLGTLNGFDPNEQGNAVDVNSDGSVVVGWTSGGEADRRAFRWVEGGTEGVAANPEMQDLGTLRTDQATGDGYALGTNNGGDVVVGYARDDSNFFRAFRWIDGGSQGTTSNPEMEDLGTLSSDQTQDSYARDVSADGDIVVGYARSDTDMMVRAFRWVEGGSDGVAANPEMEDLGTLRSDEAGDSAAYGISADGSVVVGRAANDDRAIRAFRWVEGGSDGVAANPEMQDLGTLRTDQTGNAIANGVSADGDVVVGLSEVDGGGVRAFIWRTEMQDYESVTDSFPVIADDTEIAVAQQQAVVGRLMDETCLAEEDQSCLHAGGWLAYTGSTAAQDIGSRRSSVATLTYGRGLDGQTTVGGTLSVSGSSLSSNGFDMGTGVGFSLWSEYSEGGLARTGLQAGAAVGWGRESGSITRGLGIDNVMLATGDSSLETFGARATVGYGFETKDWLITPSATLSHFQTSRGAYAEAGSDFNASYDALSLDRTTVNLQLSGERLVSERGTLTLGAGLEHDLSADRVTLTGSSTLPGMESFAVDSTLERKRTRGFLEVGYRHDYSDDRSLSGTLRVGEAPFGTAPQVSIGVNYGIRF